jgi:hypothetical protein
VERAFVPAPFIFVEHGRRRIGTKRISHLAADSISRIASFLRKNLNMNTLDALVDARLSV